MTASSQTPRIGPAVLPLHQSPQATVFVDRDGDEWIPDGVDAAGELRLSCPEPAEPGDQGEGESHPWTLSEVRSAFGPLTERSAVSA
ncbi:hypothetical protein [Streptomyces sp. NPDC086182]|uniref:hypothetical protein n=1 Tax=Streptomyces sp. NPDC086182 TaxID=3155058 RepID=UPI0034149326